MKPPPHQDYTGPITNTYRWQHFSPRRDDIFVCTPPKCGTTWTQAICAMLVFGRVDHGQQPAEISPWIDAEFEPIEDYLRIVDAQTHRRFLKTHSPFDGIPYDPACTYFAVLRDPRDVYFSGNDHRDNMIDRTLAATFPSGDNAFDVWLHGECAPGGWDQWTLDTLVRFFRSYWDYRELPNLHLFHYSDMKHDLPGTIAAMSRALGYDYDEATIETFAAAASFDVMKSNAERFAPQSGIGFWKSESGFFARGRQGEWKSRWSDAERQAFDLRLDALLDAPASRWLLEGANPK